MTPTAEHSALRLLPQSMGMTAGAAIVKDSSGEAGAASGFAGLIEALGQKGGGPKLDEASGSVSIPQTDDPQDGLTALPSALDWLSFIPAAAIQTPGEVTETTGETDVKNVESADETAATMGITTPVPNVPLIAVATSAASTAALATPSSTALSERKSKMARDVTATPAQSTPTAANAVPSGPSVSIVEGAQSTAALVRPEPRAIEIQIDTKVSTVQNADMSANAPDLVVSDKSQPAIPQAPFIDALSAATKGDQPGTIDSPQMPADPVVISTTEPNWEVEFVDSIVAQVTGEDAVIDLSLTPDNLGKVEVRVELRDGRADVTFVTETRDAARLFAQAEGRLSDLMQRHGLDLGGQASSHRDASPRQSGGQPAHATTDTDAAPLPRLAGAGRVNLVA